MEEMFPEEEEGNIETGMSWDYSNEFRCSNLFVYFEVLCIDDDEAGSTSLEALSNFPHHQERTQRTPYKINESGMHTFIDITIFLPELIPSLGV